MNSSGFDKLIEAVENGQVMAIKKDGKTIAVMLQPELLEELKEDMFNMTEVYLKGDPVKHNIFDSNEE